MMERVPEWMRVRGFAKAELAVFAPNRRARRLYESLGFIEEGIRRRHVRIRGEYVDEILMGLWLGPEPTSAAS
jgi:RimJ/RimL family protein N-acetyltransferase